MAQWSYRFTNSQNCFFMEWLAPRTEQPAAGIGA